MKRWLRNRLSRVPIHMTLRNDGMVVVLAWRAGWFDGEVRMAPDDARMLARCLAVMAVDADEAMAEAIR